MSLVIIDGTAQSKVDRGLNRTNLVLASGTLVLQKSFKIAVLKIILTLSGKNNFLSVEVVKRVAPLRLASLHVEVVKVIDGLVPAGSKRTDILRYDQLPML